MKSHYSRRGAVPAPTRLRQAYGGLAGGETPPMQARNPLDPENLEP